MGLKFNLTWEQLIDGVMYATYFDNQGIYIFRKNGEGWICIDDNRVSQTGVNTIYQMGPKNGFHSFRFATMEETHMFLNAMEIGYIVKPEIINTYELF